MFSKLKNFIALALLLTFCLPALAYVDPVSGAMLLQIVISGITGILLVCRRAIGGLVRKLIRRAKGMTDRIE